MLWWTLRRLKSKDELKRIEFVEELGSSMEPRALKPLMKLLADDSAKVRAASARALGDILALFAPRDIAEVLLEPLLKLIADDSTEARAASAGTLGRIGDARALESLVSLLADDSWVVRATAAHALGQIGDARALESLVSLLADDSAEVRADTAHALGRIGDARALEPLVKLLEDNSVGVRRRTIYAIGRTGDEQAKKSLVSFLKDEEEQIRSTAEEVLDKVETPEVDKALSQYRREKLKNTNEYTFNWGTPDRWTIDQWGEWKCTDDGITYYSKDEWRRHEINRLFNAVHRGELGECKSILKHGFYINYAAPDSGLTALHIAASAGHTEIVRGLLRQGADINAICRLGMTPSDYALLEGHADVAELLLLCRDSDKEVMVNKGVHEREPKATQEALQMPHEHEVSEQNIDVNKNNEGECSICGRKVYDFSMSETDRIMRSGQVDTIMAIATLCLKCNTVYCAGCAHKSNTKCPKCGVTVVSHGRR